MVGIQARTASGDAITLDAGIAEQLKASFMGQILLPEDSAYDQVRRVWNGMIDKRPAMIARCAGVSDIRRAVEFARSNNLLVAVRGGGHSAAGKGVCNGGIMIDLSLMRNTSVDPLKRIARAEPGATWREFDHATQAFGLASTGGVISTTGIAGLTLGGGIGRLGRKYGLTCDNLLSADVVTADGDFLMVSEEENADLFWGLRGGGGNFGVVTSFEYRLHPIGPMVLAGELFYSWDKVRDMLRYYHEFATSAPEELAADAFLLTLPQGGLAAAISLCYLGPIEEGEKVMEPLRKYGPPLMDKIGLWEYAKFQGAQDTLFPKGLYNYWKANFLTQLTDSAIYALLEGFAGVPSPLSVVTFQQMGGYINRVKSDATAFNHRSALYDFFVLSRWTDPSDTERQIGWTRNFWDVMSRFSPGGVYVNHLGDEGEERIRAAYGSNYDRLVQVKSKYDPTNLFRLNQNIKPLA